jgi:hypothetical protein
MEKLQREVLSVPLLCLGLAAISLFAFPKELKIQIRKEQDNICAKCERKVKKLQIHHKIPQSMGGSDERSNAVGLCDKDHKVADDLALNYGIIFKYKPK